MRSGAQFPGAHMRLNVICHERHHQDAQPCTLASFRSWLASPKTSPLTPASFQFLSKCLIEHPAGIVNTNMIVSSSRSTDSVLMLVCDFRHHAGCVRPVKLAPCCDADENWHDLHHRGSAFSSVRNAPEPQYPRLSSRLASFHKFFVQLVNVLGVTNEITVPMGSARMSWWTTMGSFSVP